MTQLTPYRERLPHTRTVEVRVKRWVIREPNTRANVILSGCSTLIWASIVLTDVIGHHPQGWTMVALHSLCALMMLAATVAKLERREVVETEQITE